MAEIVLLVTQISCNSISKRQDQTLNVRVNYTYKGPARTGRLVAVVTTETLLTAFNEVSDTSKKTVYITPPAADTPQPCVTDITGIPLSPCDPKSGYGIKVYALDFDGQPEWGCLNVLTVTAVAVVTPEVNIISLAVS